MIGRIVSVYSTGIGPEKNRFGQPEKRDQKNNRTSRPTRERSSKCAYESLPAPRRVLGREDRALADGGLFTLRCAPGGRAGNLALRRCLRLVSPFRTNSVGKLTSLKMSRFEGRFNGRCEGLLHLCRLSRPSKAAHRPAAVCRSWIRAPQYSHILSKEDLISQRTPLPQEIGWAGWSP